MLFGAAAATGIDIDPVAAEVARANCSANGVAVDIQTGTLTPEHESRYDLVVANVNTDANIGMATALAKVTAPGGSLLLSGILGQDVPRVVAAMAAAGLARAGVAYERDWGLVELRPAGTG
jgi:ribosomal protein L11 methyltransferase